MRFAFLFPLAAIALSQSSVDKAVELASQGKLEQAEVILAELERAAPQDPDIEYRFGLVLLKRGKLDQARQRLELAARLNPQSPFVWRALGLLHDTLGKAEAARNDLSAAVKDLQAAIRLDPEHCPYYLDLSQLFLDHDTPEPAEIVLGKAVQRCAGNADVERMLGLAYYAQGKNQQALDAFLSAIDASPDEESSYATLQVLLTDAQPRLPELIEKLRKFSERHPESPIGHYLLALVLPSDSARLLQQAIRVAPDFWPAWFELAKLEKTQEKWPEAAAALKKTVALQPNYAPAHYLLAEYYNQTGDRARAVEERELHHKLLNDQRLAAEKQRAQTPRLAYTVEP
jgi:tetratricopeptide (TPR) repeat protein